MTWTFEFDLFVIKADAHRKWHVVEHKRNAQVGDVGGGTNFMLWDPHGPHFGKGWQERVVLRFRDVGTLEVPACISPFLYSENT